MDIQEAIERERQEEQDRLERVSAEIRSGRRSRAVCDKCGLPVPTGNDAAIIGALLGNFMAMFATPRHLLPVIENGEVICEGSPSRAQYLPGQARDKRLSYAYRPENEQKFREAYAQLQKEEALEVGQMN